VGNPAGVCYGGSFRFSRLAASIVVRASTKIIAQRVNHFSPLGFSLRCTALQNSGSKMLNSAACFCWRKSGGAKFTFRQQYI